MTVAGAPPGPPSVFRSTKIKRIRGRHYLYEREGYWDTQKGQTRYRNEHSLGPCDAEGNLLQAPRVTVDEIHAATPIGALAVFWAVAKEWDLLGQIARVVGDLDTSRHVLVLAMNQATGRRPTNHVSDWVAQTPLPSWLGLQGPVTRPKLDAALDGLCSVDEFGTYHDPGVVLQHALTKAWRGRSREPAQYYYDTTKIEYHGTKCALAEHGHHAKGSCMVVGFGLVTSRTHHHPVVCRAQYGSRHDTLSVHDTVHYLKGMGFRGLTLIMDRGMVSQGNIELLRQSGYHQLGIVPETNKEVWDMLAKWTPNQLEKAEHVAVRGTGIVYARAWNTRFRGRRMRLCLVADPYRRVREQANRDRLIHDARTSADAQRLSDVRHALGNLAVPSRGRRGWRVDEQKAEEDRQYDGRFLLFSTDLSLSAQQMVTIYFQRESIEHVFRVGNTDLGLSPIRYHLPERIHAYTTILYLAWFLWSWAERGLRKKYPQMSLHAALDSLENLRFVRFGSKNRVEEWATRPNKEQEALLKHLKALEFVAFLPSSTRG